MALPRNLPLVLLLAGGCVFPAGDPTGIELSWLFVESNLDDGEEGQRVRTCSGATAKDLQVTITDQADADRTRTFPHDCSEGFQTVEEFQIEPSDVFVSLNPGDYDLRIEVINGGGATLAQEEREVPVRSRGITVQALDLPVPTLSWSIDLRGLGSCTDLALSLVYDDAESALTVLPAGSGGSSGGGTDGGADTDGAGSGDVVYRAGLASEGGLSLGGDVSACAALTSGIHTFAEVDVGVYRLLVEMDGMVCEQTVRLDRPDMTTVLDLANPPCPG